MKIVFYGRTQVGSVVLSYLVAQGHEVKVIPEDDLLRDLIKIYSLEEVTLDTMGEFDLFVCCHGEKIIKPEYLKKGMFINMHSCLYKYVGKDPISRYIANGDTDASIESHYMVEEVDSGEVIDSVHFKTPVVKTHGEYFNLALPHYYKCIDNTMKKLGWNKSVAMTRFARNESLLEMWLKYYSQFFDKLVVFVCNSTNGMIDEILEKYNAEKISIPTDIYSLQSHQAVFEKQKELLKEYEWVMYCDMDEVIVPEPDLYKDLKDYMKRCREQQTFCEGWEIIKQGGKEGDIDYQKPILEQRHLWCRDLSGSYNKPALSRIPTKWALGFHYIEGEQFNADKIKARENTGLYMFHLKNINSTEAPKHCTSKHRENKDFIKQIPEKFKGKF